MCKQEHKHAIILRAIADGKQIQVGRANGTWAGITAQEALSHIIHYSDVLRIKPKTILINGMEVPEPVQKPLSMNESYFYVCIPRKGDAFESTWVNDAADRYRLKLGVIHTSMESAKAHAEALLSFTQQR